MSSSVENADAPDVRLQCKWTLHCLERRRRRRRRTRNLDLGDLVSSSRVKVLLILGSMLVNGMFYKSLPSRYSPLVKSYIVSSFHAFVSVFTVANYFLRCEINLKQINRLLGGGVTGTSDELIFVSVCYSSGYLMYDFLLMLICKSVRTGSALLHHVLILLSFCSGRDQSLFFLSLSLSRWWMCFFLEVSSIGFVFRVISIFSPKNCRPFHWTWRVSIGTIHRSINSSPFSSSSVSFSVDFSMVRSSVPMPFTLPRPFCVGLGTPMRWTPFFWPLAKRLCVSRHDSWISIGPFSSSRSYSSPNRGRVNFDSSRHLAVAFFQEHNKKEERRENGPSRIWLVEKIHQCRFVSCCYKCNSFYWQKNQKHVVAKKGFIRFNVSRTISRWPSHWLVSARGQQQIDSMVAAFISLCF